MYVGHLEIGMAVKARILWSLLWGAFFLKNRQLAAIAALAVFSHFVVDLLHGALVTTSFLVPGLVLSWLNTCAERLGQVPTASNRDASVVE